jgi:O-antigen ligase
MKRLFYIEDRTENRISYYHLLCFLLLLPFDRFYSTIVLVSFLVHSIIFFNKVSIRKAGSPTFILQSVFFVTMLSTLYAVSFSGGINIVTKQLAILLFPFLLAISSLDIDKYRSRLLEIFAIGCTCTVLYLFGDALHVIWYEKLPLGSLFTHAFVNHNFSLPLDLHATYFSMFIIISVVYFLQQLFTENSVNRRLFIAICLLILIAGLVQLSSKSAFIALAIIINIGIPWFLLKNPAKLRFLFISLSLSVLFATFILTVDVFRERFFVYLKNDLFKGPENEKLDWRIYRWEAAVDLVKKSPVIGNGTGSEIPMLKELYYDKKMYSAYLSSLNVHNQYLSFLINSGIAGLFIYISTLFWGFWQAIKRKDILLFSFMILTSVVSFSEDMLDVNKGIFFYAFFFSFLVLHKRKQLT